MPCEAWGTAGSLICTLVPWGWKINSVYKCEKVTNNPKLLQPEVQRRSATLTRRTSQRSVQKHCIFHSVLISGDVTLRSCRTRHEGKTRSFEDANAKHTTPSHFFKKCPCSFCKTVSRVKTLQIYPSAVSKTFLKFSNVLLLLALVTTLTIL